MNTDSNHFSKDSKCTTAALLDIKRSRVPTFLAARRTAKGVLWLLRNVLLLVLPGDYGSADFNHL